MRQNATNNGETPKGGKRMNKRYRCLCIEERMRNMFGKNTGKAYQNYECPFCKGEEE